MEKVAGPPERLLPLSRLEWWLRAILLLGVYIAAGKFGLSLAFVNASATAVWPPTGIALATLVLYGLELWPIIFVGALFVNVTTAGSVVSSLGIAIGNTLEALIGAALVIRFAGGPRAVERPQDLFKLALLTAAVSTPVSATIGVTSLALTGFVQRPAFGSVWITWWLGDFVGAWLFAPLLLSWSLDPGVRWTRARAAEAGLLIATVLVVAELVFGGLGVFEGSRLRLEFLCIPVLLWAAFRLGFRETTTAAFILSLIALRGTIARKGPFAEPSPNEALVLLQTFLGVVAMTAAAIATLVRNQRRADERAKRFNRELEQRVTERTEQLAKSEERLMEAQRVAHIGSWEWDVVSDRVWWSEELRRIYGVDADTDVAGYRAFLERLHPDDRALAEETISHALADRQPFGFEHRVLRPGGEVRTLYGYGHVVTDESGRVVRMTGTGQDITESKRLERQRAQLFHEQAARREAEQANQLKDAFLATLSHELRTPLNAIVGWLQILRTRELEPAMRRTIDVLDRNATVLRRLIEDMLDVSAILTGKLHIHRELLDLGPLVAAVVDSLRPAADAKQIRLVCSVSPATVEGDSQRLQQVVTNLLSNALKFTAPGGLVSVEVCETDGHVRLRVSDTGVGIPEESLPYIFDAFRQADASLTRAYGGLGLGLAIVREVVELLGGRVSAQRGGLATDGERSGTTEGDGGGATFTVILPMAPQSIRFDTEPGRLIAAEAYPTLAGLRVLAVDDDKDSRDLLNALFGSAGASFVGAGSASEGLDECAHHHPDLLLVDLARPEQDGYTFVARARQLGVRSPAIAITAYADEAHRADALAGGFDAHLPKPLALEDLLSTVASVLERARG